ncbi:putative C6 transcription factor protein [Botryosphaeria dothidea]|uniref:C6 transcription factor protein n=1 Tax=Botryosphaeria dothidea TaxID=55169 RepID=A0A8H4IHN1_9PEZI|nr:putative C6 transcription factor protein [Botryosphaeria dothidea]
MAGPGGGPSRRSHTKSRKGCKTCKKRHIRCDETFPQCRNCTKHQVRCDYNDNPASAAPDSPKGPQQPNLLWTPEIEATINIWQSTGEFPFPELNVYPQPQWRNYSKTDLRLIHHLSSISNEMFRGRTSKLTVWAENMPKFLSIASSYPFVMHSILAFSASHLAWISQSTETRNLAIAHGGIALKGLHEAIGNFSRANSDAILASSLLLSWQATDCALVLLRRRRRDRKPIFPDIGAAFCADNALLPLEEIIRYVNTLQATQGYAQAVPDGRIPDGFPPGYRLFVSDASGVVSSTDGRSADQAGPYGLDTLNLDLETQIQEYGYGQSLSPAFAPSPLHVQAPGIMEARSPYLEVPRSAIDYRPSSAYSSPLGSPAAPPISYAHEDNMFNFGGGMGPWIYRRGSVLTNLTTTTTNTTTPQPTIKFDTHDPNFKGKGRGDTM